MTNSYMFRTGLLTTMSAAALAFIGTAATVASVHADTGKASFRNHVETSIARHLRLPDDKAHSPAGVATVAVGIDADGAVRSTSLLRSSGVAAYDEEALRTAQTVSYPATGKPRTVAMVLGFNRTVSATEQRQAQQLADNITNTGRDRDIRLAETVSAQPES